MIEQYDHDLEPTVQADEHYEARRVHRKPIRLDPKLHDLLKEANEQFYGFELNDLAECYFARYEEGDHYEALHTDCQAGFDHQRKLSFSLLLNTDYEGGEFGTHNEQVVKHPGRLIVFPSYVLHSVRPVTKGVRYAIYGFLSGPDWR